MLTELEIAVYERAQRVRVDSKQMQMYLIGAAFALVIESSLLALDGETRAGAATLAAALVAMALILVCRWCGVRARSRMEQFQRINQQRQINAAMAARQSGQEVFPYEPPPARGVN